MSAPILVLNCGSSGIRFAMFEGPNAALPRDASWSGKVAGIGSKHANLFDGNAAPVPVALDPEDPYLAALQRIRACVDAHTCGQLPAAVAHRVTHGGRKYTAPVRVDARVLADLESLVPLAPLHQPFALKAIDAVLGEMPLVPQVACFDTAFHCRSLAPVEQMLPLPFAYAERAVCPHGFHGLSYEYMTIALAERYGDRARGRTIVAHLGDGASLCAMRGLRRVATSMGFSAVDGLLVGIVREIGALVAVLGGLDMLAFTGGVGEHNAELRARICAGLAWLELAIDHDANRANASTISRPANGVRVVVEPTNEEWITANHAFALLAKGTEFMHAPTNLPPTNLPCSDWTRSPSTCH